MRDLATGITQRISLGVGGVESNGDSRPTSISKDGRYVTFESRATNLFAGDVEGTLDVLLHDRVAGTARRASIYSPTWGGTVDVGGNSSNDGRFVVFAGFGNVYVRDLQQNTTAVASVDARTGAATGEVANL